MSPFYFVGGMMEQYLFLSDADATLADGNASPSLRVIQGAIIKLVLCSKDWAQPEACQQCFPAELCHFAFASRHFADIVAAGFGKAQVMTALDVESSDEMIEGGGLMGRLLFLLKIKLFRTVRCVQRREPHALCAPDAGC